MITWDSKPNPGRIRTYTSGCPKNQKRCWKRIGSPPPLGSKKVVLKFRSNSSMVIAPANTGKLNSNRMSVINSPHRNSSSSPHLTFLQLKIVVIMLIAPAIEETPAAWMLKIAKSILPLLCPREDDRGG